MVRDKDVWQSMTRQVQLIDETTIQASGLVNDEDFGNQFTIT